MASGVNLRKANSIEHQLLSKYFQKDRWARILETEAVALAAAGKNEAAAKALRKLTEILVPELENSNEDFRVRAAKAMPAWDDQVFAIESDSNGRPGVRRYNVADVKDEFEAFAKAAEANLLRLERNEKPKKGTGQKRQRMPPPGSIGGRR